MSSLIVPIVTIKSIEKHPNADTLVIVRFNENSWQTIEKQGYYQVGDEIIFVPPDSIIPQFIITVEKISYLKNNAGRTGTIKLRGELSEGLILPKSILGYIPISHSGAISPIRNTEHLSRYKVGDNVAALLHITKWEPPEVIQQRVAESYRLPKQNKNFPKYVDIENIKNFPDLFAPDEQIIVTEKIHGTNFRAGWAKKPKLSLLEKIKRFLGLDYKEYYYTCGSRNVEYGLESNKSSFYGKNYYQELGKLLKDKIPYGYIIFGEIYGDKIQDLTYGKISGEWDFVIFDVMTTYGQYLSYFESPFTLSKFCLDFGFKDKLVPILYLGLWKDCDLESLTRGESVLYPGQLKEGCVIRSIVETSHPLLGRKIVKSINLDYLVRKNGTERK